MPAITSDKPRKEAPQAMIRSVYVDEREVLVDQVRKKLGDKGTAMHFFYGDPIIAAKGQYEREGYKACGVDHKGDPLFMRPERINIQHLSNAAGASADAKDVEAIASDAKYKTRTSDGRLVSPSLETE